MSILNPKFLNKFLFTKRLTGDTIICLSVFPLHRCKIIHKWLNVCKVIYGVPEIIISVYVESEFQVSE